MENTVICNRLEENLYEFDACKLGSDTLTSASKVTDDFTNTNPDGCPITWRVDKSDTDNSNLGAEIEEADK